ncbi:MAG: nucleoside hydrolase [Woeseiaceae bacterium]|nr:nucleoside hydrolase [Woeseiaceae bacterium]|tara:strand:+ start:47 stop:988 length:942 start_codon:yes stop_codon:yes gene_type:complete
MSEKIIIDCDPGQDDAVALFLALSSPEELEILGITTVAGNVPLKLTERNARIICDIADSKETEVFAGCSRPMLVDLMTAENVHGKTGIDGIDIFKPKTPLKELHAVDFIVKTLKDADTDSITLVPTGPLTNIALAIIKDPSILDSIKQIVLMGGAMREAGNLSASAEFNMRVDPHAAKVVFECGLPIIVMSLDVTHKVLTSKERVSEIESIGNSVSTATANMLKFFARYDSEKYGVDGAPLHDPCTIAWLLNQNLFIGKECNVRIETESSLTLGHTSVDFWGVEGNIPNAIWMQDVDDDGFYDLLINRLRRFD